MTCSPKIAAIVLAAGLSTRSGPVNKLLHSVDGKVMVRSVVDLLTAVPIDPVIVVTGFEALKIEAALSGCPVIFVHNSAFEHGMGGSIGCGVAALADDVDGVLICLGDMPHVNTDTIHRLCEAFKHGGIYVPIKGGRHGNPVLFAREHFKALTALNGDRGGKAVIQRNALRVQDVPVDDDGIFIDHDLVGV